MDLSLKGTELSRIPVRFGIIKPPKKRRAHSRTIKAANEFTKGIGKATKEAKLPTTKQR
jgi:hypothetical protein